MTRPAADLLVVNARLWSGRPLPDADGLAVAQGKIAAVGRTADLEVWRTPATRVIDARGATVTPGLCDAHIHLLAWARSRFELDLDGCATLSEALGRVERHLAGRPGRQPVVGRGWKSDDWEAQPDAARLDRVTGARPVLLHGKDYHSLWVNGAALAAAGIDRHRAEPSGGVIERDAHGAPTGILRENAVRLVSELEREATTLAPEEVLEPAVQTLHAFGVTAIHDFEGAEAFHALRRLGAGERPLVRVLMHLPHQALDHALAVGLESGVGDDSFRIGALKLFADGTLGSRTAAVLEPYDGTDQRGLDVLAPGDLAHVVGRALAGGLSVAFHAIGDRAVRSALDALEAGSAWLPRLALPPRIEHVQLIAEDDVRRFAALEVTASMQPTHCTSDIELAERYWKSRAHRTYPWRLLAEGGVRLAFGSDAPVESPSVAAGLHAAVTRERRDRPAPYVPEQRIDLDQALVAYTRAPAQLSGTWPRLGALRPSAWADLVVWNTDLHRLEPAALAGAHPVLTAIAGQIVHESGASGSAGRASSESEKRVMA